jgi:hypothetical protein
VSSVAAAYLPAGRALNEAHAKRRALTVEMREAANSHSVVWLDLIERFYRLQLQIYNDLKALGLTPCLGKPPRAPISG